MVRGTIYKERENESCGKREKKNETLWKQTGLIISRTSEINSRQSMKEKTESKHKTIQPKAQS